MVFWFANAYATFDSHVHTGNGPIDSWPNITVTGTHKIRVCAPTIGTISAYTWISGPEFEDQVDASNGNSATSSGHTLSSGANVLFDSWVSGYGSGTGKAYLADIGTTLPNCSAQ
ncbi:hypothetical protein HUU59_13405 [bacterium]|nr:hypothetical protein [bacterium]